MLVVAKGLNCMMILPIDCRVLPASVALVERGARSSHHEAEPRPSLRNPPRSEISNVRLDGARPVLDAVAITRTAGPAQPELI